MKRYIVQSFVNDQGGDYYEYNTYEEAKKDFDERVEGIPFNRKFENGQAVIKFKDDDSWGYDLYSDGDETGEIEELDYASKTWGEVKEEK